MFTESEVKLMEKIGLKINFDNLSDEDYIEIEDVVGAYLTLKCLDNDYNPDSEGIICYSILDKVA